MSLIFAAANQNAISVVNATETALISVGPVIPPRDTINIVLQWAVRWAMGTGETGQVFNLRRGPLGTVADPIVGIPDSNTWPAPTSGGTASRSGVFLDVAVLLSPVIYTLTITRTGGSDSRNTASQSLVAFLF